MVGKANPDQLQFPPDAFGVAIEEFGRDGFRRPQESGHWAGQSGCPICAHEPMIRANWLDHQ
jgi:hypothetical protein